MFVLIESRVALSMAMASRNNGVKLGRTMAFRNYSVPALCRICVIGYPFELFVHVYGISVFFWELLSRLRRHFSGRVYAKSMSNYAGTSTSSSEWRVNRDSYLSPTMKNGMYLHL